MRNSKSKLRFLFIFLALIIFAAGCSYPSGVNVFHSLNSEVYGEQIDAREILRLALATNEDSEIAQKVWFTGWIRNYVQKRKTTSMYDGVIIRPHGYYVNARMAGVPFRYYKWDDSYYIWTSQDDWSKIESGIQPFDPFYGLTWWEPFLANAIQLPNEKILSKESLVFQVEVNGKDWIEQSDTPLFADLPELISQTPGLNSLIEQSTIKMTIWIGDEQYSEEKVKEAAQKKGIQVNNKEELNNWIEKNHFIWNPETNHYHHHMIYQYQTWINMPIPGAGYMDQETYFRFYKYDDVGIKMRTVAEMENYVKQKEAQKGKK